MIPEFEQNRIARGLRNSITYIQNRPFVQTLGRRVVPIYHAKLSNARSTCLSYPTTTDKKCNQRGSNSGPVRQSPARRASELKQCTSYRCSYMRNFQRPKTPSFLDTRRSTDISGPFRCVCSQSTHKRHGVLACVCECVQVDAPMPAEAASASKSRASPRAAHSASEEEMSASNDSPRDCKRKSSTNSNVK